MKDNSNIIELANIGIDPIRHEDTGIIPGSIMLANDSRFDSAYLSEPLTAYAVGFRDPSNLDDMINFLAPKVAVPRKFEYRVGQANEPFYTETDDERAIGANFKRVEYSGSTTVSKTLNRGLTYRADLDQWADIQGWREQITRMLIQRLKRNRLRRIMALYAASATNVNKTWCTGGKASNPHLDIEAVMDTAANKSGLYPNTALFAFAANTLRKKSYQAQDNAGASIAAAMSLADMAADLGLSRGAKVSKERYATKKTGDKSKVLSGNLIYLSYLEDGATTEDASNVKLFWSNTMAGGEISVYNQRVGSGEKFEDITVELYERLSVTHSSGLMKMTITEDTTAPS